MRHTFAAFLLVFFLMGCAPKVVTDMYTNEWPATSPDSVLVFRMNETVPPNSMAIGQVKVVDNGFSSGGSFERVMEMAIDATAQNGGNGLILTEHRTPDHRSTIHRIWGTILRIPETAIVARDTTESVKLQKLRQLLSEEEYAEFMEYKNAKQNYEEQRQYYEERRQQMMERLSQSPRNVFRLNAGPSLLCSKYEVGNHTYKTRVGFDLCADYDHVWMSGFGFGLNYVHNYTSFNEGVTTRMNYIGPSLVMASPLSNTLRCDLAFGFGYCRYTEYFLDASHGENSVGAMIRLGAEWKVAKHLALGAQLNMLVVSLKKPDDMNIEKDEFYGIRHISLHGGLRYYF